MDIGCARVFTGEQILDLQLDASGKAGAARSAPKPPARPRPTTPCWPRPSATRERATPSSSGGWTASAARCATWSGPSPAL